MWGGQVNNDPCGMCNKDPQILVTDEMGNGNKKDIGILDSLFKAFQPG